MLKLGCWGLPDNRVGVRVGVLGPARQQRVEGVRVGVLGPAGQQRVEGVEIGVLALPRLKEY